MSAITHNPLFYIILEIIAIAVLLFFVVPWTKEFKAWKAEQEIASEKKIEDDLMEALANSRRRDR